MSEQSLKLATRFFKLMDQPAHLNNAETVKSWSLIMSDCIGESELDFETFKTFLTWVVTLNPMSAEYLFLARDPAQTLKKNLPTLLRYFRAYQKREAAKSARDAKLNQTKKPKVQGSYKMTDSGDIE